MSDTTKTGHHSEPSPTELGDIRAELERTTKYYERSMEQVNVMRAALVEGCQLTSDWALQCEKSEEHLGASHLWTACSLLTRALESASEATQAEGAGEKTK